MSAADALLVLARSGAVLAAALVAVAFAWRQPALRVAAARYGLLAALVASLTVPWSGERPRPVLAVPAALPLVSLSVASHPAPHASPTAPSRSASVTTDEPVDLTRVLAPLWAAGSLVLLGQLLFGMAALRRVRRQAHPLGSPVWTSRLAIFAAELGIAPPTLVESAIVAGPCVAGLLRPTVLLPTGWVAATEEGTVEAVLRHELAHVANGDLRWGLLARLVRTLLWPQPLVWLLRRPTTAAEEEACDRQVLASGVSQTRYAAGLVALREGRRGDRVPSLAIGAVSRRSGFGRRIEAILAFRDSGGVRLSRRTGRAVGAGALALALGAAFAVAHPGPARQAPDPIAGWVKGPYAGAVDLVDDRGAPVGVTGAWIVVRGGDPTPTVWRPRFLGSAVRLTGVPAPTEGTSGVLAVRSRGHGLTFVRLWPAPTRLRQVRAVSATSLTGHILMVDGSPAAGIRVTVPLLVQTGRDPEGSVFLQPQGAPGMMPSNVTDATGAYRLEGLPPLTIVQVDTDDLRFAAVSINERATTGVSGTTVAPTVRLVAAGRIAGRVTRAGRPIAGVRIGAQANTDLDRSDVGAWGDATTDADGRYAIERLGPTVYNVSARLSDALAASLTTRAYEGVTLRLGTRIDGVDFELAPGTLVEGTVTLPDGKPLPGAMIGVYGPAHPPSSAEVQVTHADAKGRYRARVPAGAQRVYLMDSRDEQDIEHVTTREGGVTRVDLQARAKRPERDGAAPP